MSLPSTCAPSTLPMQVTVAMRVLTEQQLSTGAIEAVHVTGAKAAKAGAAPAADSGVGRVQIAETVEPEAPTARQAAEPKEPEPVAQGPVPQPAVVEATQGEQAEWQLQVESKWRASSPAPGTDDWWADRNEPKPGNQKLATAPHPDRQAAHQGKQAT